MRFSASEPADLMSISMVWRSGPSPTMWRVQLEGRQLATR